MGVELNESEFSTCSSLSSFVPDSQEKLLLVITFWVDTERPDINEDLSMMMLYGFDHEEFLVLR